MTKHRFLFLVIAIFCAGFLVVQAQDTNSSNYPQNYFPALLYCADVPADSGSEWHGLKIGESTVQELTGKVDIEPVLLDNGAWLIALRDRYIYFCESNQIITAIKVIPVSQDNEHLFIDDVLAQYGEPDAISFVLGKEYSRLFFWFSEGIAAQVYTNDRDEVNFGRVTAMVFFPYQELQGFENRYPYTRVCGDVFCGEPLFGYEPERLNPFNIEGILLTVTAQPTRTSTPVFTPYATETGVYAVITRTPNAR